MVGLCLALLATALLGAAALQSSRENPTQRFGFTRLANRSRSNYLATFIGLVCAAFATSRFRGADYTNETSIMLAWTGPLVVTAAASLLHNRKVDRKVS